MKQKPDWIERRQSTRRKAEIALSGISSAELAAQPAEVLLHELLVHKVELELQVQELQRAHVAMEEARDRYLDLYDFAPVGYVTISRECLISEINLSGAAMLGVDRIKLLKRRFSKFVAPLDQDRWHRLFMNIMEHAQIGPQAFVLEMIRADASTFCAHLDCQRREVADAAPMLRLALIDISRMKQAEAEMLGLRTAAPE
jgi:PAS domain S-box-containing protein